MLTKTLSFLGKSLLCTALLIFFVSISNAQSNYASRFNRFNQNIISSNFGITTAAKTYAVSIKLNDVNQGARIICQTLTD